MGKTDITITHTNSRSRSPSIASADHDLHQDDGVPIEAPVDSPSLSVAHAATSQSGSSSHHGDPHLTDGYVRIHLPYPNEVAEERDDIERHDQLSRIQSRDRGGTRHTSRSGSIHRYSTHTHSRDPPRSRQPPPRSPTESGDSTEEFLNRPGPHPMPRQSHYGDHNYPHSNSSGSYYGHGQPPMNQVVQHQPPPVPYSSYPMQGPPPQMGYGPPSQMSYPHYPHPPPPGSQVSSPYPGSPYGPQSMVPSQYGPPSYFPPQQQMGYPHAYPPPQQYPSHYMQGYPHQMPMPMPSYVDPLQYRVQSPAMSSPAAASDTAKDKYDQEELMKRFESLMKQQTEDRKDAEVSKEDALKQAMEQMKADSAAAAAAAAARSAEEIRLKEEARQEILRAIEEEKKRAADQTAREEKIRADAADAALKAAEAQAKALADRAAAEKKIAEDAAAAAKSAAEKEAADAAAAKEAETKKAQEEAQAKLKEAEEAAAKAKADAEAAEKKAADSAPPEKKAPVKFKDAIGRNYNFPFERCHNWRDMKALIDQAFAHIENLADWVHGEHYDLLGPDGEIIMPHYWKETIQPDMQISMMLWPFPDPKDDPDPVAPPIGEGDILNLDDILNPGGGGGGGGGGEKRRKKKAASKPSGLATWMLGGSSGKRHLKGDKRPDVAAASQHGAEQQSSCVVM